MKRYYEVRLSSVGVAVCMILLGVILTLYPEMSGTIFTRGFASIVLLFALFHVWKWSRAKKYGMGGTGHFIWAVLLLILSGIGFLRPEIILSFLPFVTGALLILDGMAKIPLMKEMWDWGKEFRWSAILSAMLPLLLGIFLTAYPFHAAAAVIRVFGIFLLADGISDLIRNRMSKNNR